MTVVPLVCAKFITIDPGQVHHGAAAIEENLDSHTSKKMKVNFFRVIIDKFNLGLHNLQTKSEKAMPVCLDRPVLVVAVFSLFVVCSFALYPFLGKAFFPRTDPGQFVVNVKVPAGTRIEVTDDYIAKMEQDIRSVVSKEDLNMIVSNIGITPDLSAIYTSNSGMHTAFIQVSLKEEHKTGSYAYMQKVRETLTKDFPDVATYFQAGGLVDSVVNQGKPAPIDIQIGGNNLQEAYQIAQPTAPQTKTR